MIHNLEIIMDALTKHLISVMDDCNYKKWQDVPYAKDFYKLWYGNPEFKKEFSLTPDGFEDYQCCRETEEIGLGA